MSSSCGASKSYLNSETNNNLEAGKYKIEADIPVYASVNLKIVTIPPSRSEFSPTMLLEKFEDGTSTLKVCRMRSGSMGNTKVTYEAVADAYNVVEGPQKGTTYLVDIPDLNATATISGFTVQLKSETKMTLDLVLAKKEDGTLSIEGTDKTNLDYSNIIVTPPRPFSRMKVKATSTMEKDSSQHKFSIEKMSLNTTCADLK